MLCEASGLCQQEDFSPSITYYVYVTHDADITKMGCFNAIKHLSCMCFHSTCISKSDNIITINYLICEYFLQRWYWQDGKFYCYWYTDGPGQGRESRGCQEMCSSDETQQDQNGPKYCK